MGICGGLTGVLGRCQSLRHGRSHGCHPEPPCDGAQGEAGHGAHGGDTPLGIGNEGGDQAPPPPNTLQGDLGGGLWLAEFLVSFCLFVVCVFRIYAMVCLCPYLYLLCRKWLL